MDRAGAGTQSTSAPPGAWSPLDTLLAVALAAATIGLRPLHLVLSRPYWFDESWMAALARAPWSRLVGLTSSAPVGFVAILKLVPGAATQRARMVTLVFAGLTVAAAYALTRTVQWSTRGAARFAAVAVAVAVMLVPISQRRNDLKQYTCDAACALALLALAHAADRRRTTGSLAAFAVAGALACPLSSTAAFVAVAGFGGLLAVALAGRAWRWFARVAAAAVIAGAAVAGYFAAVVLPHLSTALHDYWLSHYLEGTPVDVVQETWKRLGGLATELAMPAAVFIALFAVGVLALFHLGARALAVSVPVLWLEMAFIARMHKYPFLDERTSHFLLVASIVVVGIGAVALVYAGALVVGRLHRVLGALAGTALAVLLAVLFGMGAAPHVRELNIPSNEDVRAQTRYVASHHRPADIVVVDATANFGFAYYWPHPRLEYRHDSTGQAFDVRVLGVRAVYVRDRTERATIAALREGLRRLRHSPPGSRLFLVRTHMNGRDQHDWRRTFRVLRVRPRSIPVGAESLLVIDRP